MSGSTISISANDGGTLGGFLALPESGSGPGIVVIQEIFGVNAHIREVTEGYASEGYVALAPDLFWRVEPNLQLDYNADGIQKGRAIAGKFDLDQGVRDVESAMKSLRSMTQCNGKVGVVGYCFGGMMSYLTAARTDVSAASCYYGGGIDRFIGEAQSVKCPIQFHFGSQDKGIPSTVWDKVRGAFSGRDNAEIFIYEGAEHGFNCTRRASFHRFSSQLARSRTIGLMRHSIGPRYDLSALWDRHSDCEFKDRDVDETMKTMVGEPYVNHIPTMTGGTGYQELHRFYKNHFIPRLPKDTKIVPIARTVGPDRVVDEVLFCFTHDQVVDFMLPGVPPTGKYVEIPLVAIIEFRADKLYNEHIYWDQGSLLTQIGLLSSDKLPVAGVATAKKLVDERLPSNELMPNWKDSAKNP